MNKWPMRPLGGVATLFGGGTPLRGNPSLWGGDIPWITPTDLPSIDAGVSSISESKDRITSTGLANSSATLVPAGTVLFSSRATIGKVAVANTELATNQGFANFVPGPDATSRYLAYALWHHRDDIARLSGSTTFKEVSRGTLRKYKIPVPPLAEQVRIVAMLDEADAIRKLRAQADRRTADLIPALFHQMFGNGHYHECSIGELTTLITSGATPRGGDAVYTASGPLFIRSQNVRMNSLEIDGAACLPQSIFDSMVRAQVRHGDVLLNITGASIGRVAWMDRSDVSAVVSQHVCLIRPEQHVLLPEYLSVFLSLPKTQQHILGIQAGASRQALNHQQVRALSIPLPSLSEQAEFAGSVKSVSNLQCNQRSGNDAIATSFNAIMRLAIG